MEGTITNCRHILVLVLTCGPDNFDHLPGLSKPGFPVPHLLQRLIHDVGLCRLELPCRNPSLKQLINLFQRAAFELRKKHKEEDPASKVRPGPDVPVFGSLRQLSASLRFCHDRDNNQKKQTYPVHVLRVDKVRRAKASQPSKEVSQADGRSHRPRPEPSAH